MEPITAAFHGSSNRKSYLDWIRAASSSQETEGKRLFFKKEV